MVFDSWPGGSHLPILRWSEGGGLASLGDIGEVALTNGKIAATPSRAVHPVYLLGYGGPLCRNLWDCVRIRARENCEQTKEKLRKTAVHDV
jgi:hypothetical protein